MKAPAGVLLLAIVGCGGSTRFALRPAVVRDDDERPFSPAPHKDEEPEAASAADKLFFRTIGHALWFDTSGEAANVTSMDEVADSSWFTNRSFSPEDLRRPDCPAEPPIPPFTVHSTKVGGVTPGFVVKDAHGKRYVLKLDELGQYGQPEISTAADVIAARLYWAAGFNTPCNEIVYVRPADVRVDAKSKEVEPTGRERRLTPIRLEALLAQATRGPNGTLRLSASFFVAGQGIGTWRTEGRRRDDPNDVISHENRRELRGERYLAAWTDHWDSRGSNTYDSYVPARGGGWVKHYFLDFSDALGGTISRTVWPEPRSGFESLGSVSTVALDMIGFGFVRRPWDDIKADPRFPDLGFLDVAHFDPLGFAPQTPVLRWARADEQDLAWMARRMARIDESAVRVAVAQGKLTAPGEAERLVQILMGRRDRILWRAFHDVSALGDFSMRGDWLCATDFARSSGVATNAGTSYAVELRVGESQRLLPIAPRLSRTDRGLCVEVAPHFAPANARADAAARYAVLRIMRFDRGHKTVAQAHFYDLGTRWALVGIERP